MTSLIWSRGELAITYIVLVPAMVVIMLVAWLTWRRMRSDLAGLSVAIALGMLLGGWWERFRRRFGPPQWPTGGHKPAGRCKHCAHCRPTECERVKRGVLPPGWFAWGGENRDGEACPDWVPR